MKQQLDKQESEFLNTTITQWEKDGLLDAATANNLRGTIEVKGFDWMRLAKYSFWVALFCGVVAFGSLLIDTRVILWIKSLYYTPNVVIAIGSGIVAALFFYYGRRRGKKNPEKIFSNEAFIFTGILFTACSIAYFGRTFDDGSHHFSILFLISVFIYGLLAWRFNSRLIWLFALISLGSWFGTETGYQTHWANYFLGMNYPLRFVGFGLVLLAACYILKNRGWMQHFWELTYVVGLLYFFLALWMLTIFGNYGDLGLWWQVKQISLFYWGIISAAVAAAFMFFGLKTNDVVAREFGITFLIIFLYTKYFEYFWNETNIAVFFSILAASFWLIGRKAEKIWNLKK